MPIPIPGPAEYDGANTVVTVALLAVAQCVHGHNVAYTMPDVEDFPYFSDKAARWAQEHADDCPGAPAAIRAA